MLVILDTFPIASPNESVLPKLPVTQIFMVDLSREFPATVSIGAACFGVDRRTAVAHDDAGIV